MYLLKRLQSSRSPHKPSQRIHGRHPVTAQGEGEIIGSCPAHCKTQGVFLLYAKLAELIEMLFGGWLMCSQGTMY